MLEVGTVAQLRRFPVKSMLGELIDTADITAAGLGHDRRYALIDTGTGRIASAKQPRLWRTLLRCRSVWDGRTVAITLPDGQLVRASADCDGDGDGDGDGVDVGVALSRALGRPVHLSNSRPEHATLDRPDAEAVIEHGVEADVDYRTVEIGGTTPTDTFVDYAPVSLFTTATLDRLATEAVRYRPNVLIRTNDVVAAYAENTWAGREISVGPVRLRGIMPIPRCAIPTLAHGELPRRVEAVRDLLRENRLRTGDGRLMPCAGLYGEVLAGGTVRPGDPVALV